jgi:hypothetical protein
MVVLYSEISCVAMSEAVIHANILISFLVMISVFVPAFSLERVVTGYYQGILPASA